MCSILAFSPLSYLYIQIADFSEAERSGFLAAFIRFWTLRPKDTRSREQLTTDFEAIYRGCTQHFRAGVTRIKKISGVIEKRGVLESLDLVLLCLDETIDDGCAVRSFGVHFCC